VGSDDTEEVEEEAEVHSQPIRRPTIKRLTWMPL
jgi:hypothetical protein